ncbi:glutaredoxin family protein [Ilumatobacter nonamiensis]|uniref:glutaredoxin family protein n=1 Tax=Ilumatobacter nonamiensis TaxID=467093 RepID=UPI00034C1ACF|nr:glutaredoxin domain-containing protein [Ilumatobacter nonamiensis]
MRRWYDRWSAPAAFALFAVLAATSFDPPASGIIVGLCLAAGLWWSPLRPGRHVDQASAAVRSGVVIYWKPGCMYCAKLQRALPRAAREQVTWVNIWRDDEAAEFVMDLNDGNELTPTVIAGGRRVEPDPGLIVELVDAG